MSRQFQLIVEGKSYEAIAVLAAHPGRAVLISMMLEGSEVGLVKLTSSLPMAALRRTALTDTQFLDEACEQFRDRQLAARALQSSDRPWILELE